jgi:hypothetical protein
MAVSEKQVLANRQNAIHSTGPKSEQGKAIASQNALRHGLRSENMVIPGETPEEFDQFRQLLQDDLSPTGAMEVFLADRIVQSFWKLRRAGRIETEIIKGLHDKWASDQQHHQKQIQARQQSDLERKITEQAYQNPDRSDDYEKVHAAWNASNEAKMIRENRWPQTPGHPSPEEVMKNYVAEHTLKLRQRHQVALNAKIDQEIASATAARSADDQAKTVPSTALGQLMQQDITGSNILARFRLCEGQIERSLYKALTELQKLQILRSGKWRPEPSDA